MMTLSPPPPRPALELRCTKGSWLGVGEGGQGVCLGPEGTPGMFSISNHECLGYNLTNGAGGMPCSYLCTYGEIETPPHSLPARGEVCFCCVDSPSRTQPVCCALLRKWTKNLGPKLSVLWKKGAVQLSPCALLEISVSSHFPPVL